MSTFWEILVFLIFVRIDNFKNQLKLKKDKNHDLPWPILTEPKNIFLKEMGSKNSGVGDEILSI